MTLDEKWLPVVGYEGYYEVSDHGNVRSIDRTIYVIDGRVRRQPGAPIQSHPNKGYPYVRLTIGGHVVNHAVHRLVAIAFLGEREGLDVCHNDGNPGNPHVSNLRWDTRSGNMSDRLRHGTLRHWNSEKIRCKHGHEFTPENTYFAPKNGMRACRTCKNDRYFASLQRKKAAA